MSNLETAICTVILSVNGLIDVYLLITESIVVIDSDMFLIPSNTLIIESLDVTDSDSSLSDRYTLVTKSDGITEIAIALFWHNNFHFHLQK